MTPRLYISEIDATATADEAIFSRYRLDKLRAVKSAARRAEGICAERLLIYALRDTMPEIEFPVEIVTDKSGQAGACGCAAALQPVALWGSLRLRGV